MSRASRLRAVAGAVAFAAAAASAAARTGQADEDYLNWTVKQAEAIATRAYQRGRVGGFFDTRRLDTERSYNYKLAATWLTPEVIRATARVLQVRGRLPNQETRALVAAAESSPGTVLMIELDPREGAGVIPRDWTAVLQPKGRPEGAVRGTLSPELREVKALAGVLRRNYDYDRFWLTFPLRSEDGTALFADTDRVAELIVRIIDKEGRVEWPVPVSARPGRAVQRTGRLAPAPRLSPEGGSHRLEP